MAVAPVPGNGPSLFQARRRAQVVIKLQLNCHDKGRRDAESLRQQNQSAHVRFGSKTDIAARLSDVRFTPKSGNWLCALGMRGVKQRFYSITLSACRRRLEGTGWPIVFAVFKLIMSSNRVGCSIGISAGIVPRKTLTAMLARIRYTPVKRGP